MSTLALDMQKQGARPKEQSGLAFKAVLAISFLYYARPEDVIPGLNHIPMVKIAGILALAALVFGVRDRAVKKLPMEIKLLGLLMVQMIITIPFAYWRGGAFNTVFFRFSKDVIMALLVTLLVTSMGELKKLLWVQAASLSIMTIASIAAYHGGRMQGVLGGVFENPNDLAFNMALNWPLCFAFLLLANKAWKKAVWAILMFIMVVGVVLTYSRSGFAALILAAVVSLYQFGLKGRRLHLVIGAGLATLLLAMVAPIVGVQPGFWITRMESAVLGNIKGSQDKGSREARTELLKLSLQEMASHPIVGVGPGNFQIFGGWHVAHNTYTEFGAEAGLPALFLFLLILSRGFINLRRVGKSQTYKHDPQLRIFNGAMWASFAAYLFGAAFSDTQYELFPYFMVAYTTVLYHMACVFPRKNQARLEDDKRNGSEPGTRLNHGPRTPETVWTR